MKVKFYNLKTKKEKIFKSFMAFETMYRWYNARYVTLFSTEKQCLFLVIVNDIYRGNILLCD